MTGSVLSAGFCNTVHTFSKQLNDNAAIPRGLSRARLVLDVCRMRIYMRETSDMRRGMLRLTREGDYAYLSPGRPTTMT